MRCLTRNPAPTRSQLTVPGREASPSRHVDYLAPSYLEEFGQAGEARQRYQRISEQLGFPALTPPGGLAERLREQPLGDSIVIHPSPLVLSAQEALSLRRGAAELTKTLSAFFADLVLGPCRCMNARGPLPEALVRELLSETYFESLQELRRIWKNRAVSDVRFFVGPDAIRLPDGNFRWMEVNVGNIGGFGDADPVREAYERAAASESAAPALALSTRQVSLLVAALRDSLPAGTPLICPDFTAQRLKRSEVDPRQSAAPLDHEDRRLLMGLEAAGVLKIAPSEIHLQAIGNSRPFLFNQQLIDGAMAEAFAAGACDLLNAPGTSILSNKLLLPYLSALSQFYFGEDLSILPIDSVNLVLERSGVGAKRNFEFQVAFGAVTPFPFSPGSRDSVFKEVTLDRGEGIYFLKGGVLERAEVLSIRVADSASMTIEDGRVVMKSAPPFDRRARSYFACQPLVNISTLQGQRVDLRPFSFALGTKDSVESPLPWGRIAAPTPQAPSLPSPEAARFEALLKHIDPFRDAGLITNVSRGAHELVVLEGADSPL